MGADIGFNVFISLHAIIDKALDILICCRERRSKANDTKSILFDAARMSCQEHINLFGPRRPLETVAMKIVRQHTRLTKTLEER